MGIEERERKKPGNQTLLTVVALIIGGLIAFGIAYKVTYSLLNISHTPFSSFIVQPIGILYVLMWIVCIISISVVIPYIIEYWTNPLTENEEHDTLEREVILNYPYDKAFDLCLESLDKVWGWPIKSFDRQDMEIFAWSLTNSSSLMFSLTKREEDQFCVVIKGFPYNIVFGLGKELARYIGRRRCIQSLDGIRDYLLAQNPKRT